MDSLKFVPFNKIVSSFLNVFTVILTTLLLGYFNSHFSQDKEIKFEHLTPEMGLSQVTAHCILQDSKGFLWFGTEDGLNKYDGYNFTIFRHNENDTNSISDNFIWTLCEDSNQDLWVGTSNGGLNKFDREQQTFTSYKHDPDDPASISQDDVRVIFEDSRKNLWVGTNNGGLNRFNYEDETFVKYKYSLTDENSISHNSIRDIVEDNFGFLWIGTNGGGLNRFNSATEKFVRFTVSPGMFNSISSNFILSLLIDKNGTIWIGTYGRGLNKLTPSTMKFDSYAYEADNENSLINNNVNSLFEDQSGALWIGTEGGLSILNSSEEKFRNISQDPMRPSGLNNNIIRFITGDRSGLIWIGTAGGGINKYNPFSKRFIHYRHNPSDPNSLSSNMIRAVFEDSDGMLWVGTLGGGLNRFINESKNFVHYKHDEDVPASISDNSVTSIYEDRKKTLWIGTWGGGLNRLNSKDKNDRNSFEHFTHSSTNPKTVPSNTIQDIYEDSYGNLWIGTESGLSLFVSEENNFIRFQHDSQNSSTISDDRIQSKCIYEDRANNLWIGTWNGLNRISSLEKIDSQNSGEIEFYKYKSSTTEIIGLSDNRIISLYEDPSSSPDKIILWVGTVSGGLNRMIITKDPSNNSEQVNIVHYTERDGLPNNAIYGILGDERGNLWLSTNNGLSKFNPNEETFRNYSESDGLQSDQFYWGAYFRSSRGEMFFGGINGLTAFYPEDLKDNRHIPEVYITDFQLFNKPVPISEDSPLKQSILETDKIELPHDSYVMTFEYVALDYTIPEKNQYIYMLEGYDNDWIPAGNRRFVTYSGVGAGDYTFRVKGSNNDGLWNDEGTSIEVKVLPPFWSTLWFITLLIITITGLIVYFVTARVQQMLAVERLRTKLAADLHDNIGSSLTEISILSEVISKKLKNEDQSVQKNLKRISEDSRSLIDRMSDIVWLVNPKRDTLYDLILRLEDTYSELLAMTNISFTSKNLKSLEKVSLSMEHRQHLFLIFKEGINNSITHSNCSEITLDAHINGKNLETDSFG
ncbi:MAG: two-component regulator propeller domain-containing protein [Melioribacteraceae bacterium]|nr:two-component regulator propeller domain-containing protein [Melioribacteraceae bacterium]